MVSRLKFFVSRLDFQPAWMIFLIDGFFSFISASLTYLFFSRIDSSFHLDFFPCITKFLLAGVLSTLLTRSYLGVIRHTSFQDIRKLFTTLVLQLGFIFVLEVLNFFLFPVPELEIIGFYCVSSILCLFLFFNYRIAVRYVFFFSRSSALSKSRVGIFGAGESGILLMNFFRSQKKNRSAVVVFFDDEPRKCNKFISGVPVVEGKAIERYVKKYALDQIILSPKFITNKRKEEIFDVAKKLGIELKIIPNNDSWFMGRREPENLHNIEILDLLGREQIVSENTEIRNLIKDKTILVTGAAGSIGGELSRQIAQESPSQLVILDQAESPLYEITLELQKLNPGLKLRVFLCDVANEMRLEQIFKEVRIDLVFHAAAYKHVPLQEQHPYEAFRCNILGTYHLANLSVKYQVRKFIMVSTDKAVNPTNVMGATKRAAEIYIQALNQAAAPNSHTQFITTRFGNVLGSNGSVVPLFKKQIAAGGPLTLTHPEITRYFMTISEASTLVLEAAAMGAGGEIFVFDMGVPIKIKDLAEKMILLSGKNIKVVYTGLREGEKLYEELLANGENTRPTYNKKIMIARVREYAYSEVLEGLNEVFYYTRKMDEIGMVSSLKRLIPEFVSNQSRFCYLDNPTEEIKTKGTPQTEIYV